MKIIFVDANAFLRFFLNDIPKQRKEVENLLRKAQQRKVILNVPQIVIFEINYTLQKYYKLPKEEIVDKLQTIVEAPYLTVQDSDTLRSAIKLYSANNLSLADCFLYSKSLEGESELFTFDKNLQKLLNSN